MSHHSVRFTQFEKTTTSAPDSFDLWREVLRGSYDLTAADRDRPSLRISTGLWDAERLVLGFCRCGPARVDRRGALVGHSGRFLRLRWFSRGQVRLAHGSATTVISPGAIHLIDQSREIIETSTEHEQRTVFMPHVLVDYDPARHPVWASFPLDEPIGRVLADAMNSFYKELPLAAVREALVLEAGFIGLLRGLLSGALDSAAEETVARSRAMAMQRYLDRHLRMPGLGVASLLEAFGAPGPPSSGISKPWAASIGTFLTSGSNGPLRNSRAIPGGAASSGKPRKSGASSRAATSRDYSETDTGCHRAKSSV